LSQPGWQQQIERQQLEHLAPVTRSEAEDLLFLEAELLDSWHLKEWLELFTEDARYLVATPGLPPDASPDENLFLINDDRFRLGGRVTRLGKKTAHPEFPHSKTLHLVTNTRVGAPSPMGTPVSAAFITTRIKDGVTDTFLGRVRYLLVKNGGQLRIREKRCDLAMENLVPQGRITIIL
jgi:p-cumate 2,3-dioxygenase subunit beta